MPDVPPASRGPRHLGHLGHLGNYRLDGRLGAGGQGVVFRGAAPPGGPVAVKLLHARLDGTAARRAFAREIAAVRRVAPFCTAQVLDADLDGDRPYIVSETARRTGGGRVPLGLGQVKGDACYPGSVSITWRARPRPASR